MACFNYTCFQRNVISDIADNIDVQKGINVNDRAPVTLMNI